MIYINQEAPEKETRMQKNHSVSNMASSSPAKVTWKIGPNGYQKFKELETAPKNIRQEDPEKQTSIPKNHLVSTITSSSPTKVT